MITIVVITIVAIRPPSQRDRAVQSGARRQHDSHVRPRIDDEPTVMVVVAVCRGENADREMASRLTRQPDVQRVACGQNDCAVERLDLFREVARGGDRRVAQRNRRGRNTMAAPFVAVDDVKSEGSLRRAGEGEAIVVLVRATGSTDVDSRPEHNVGAWSLRADVAAPRQRDRQHGDSQRPNRDATERAVDY